MQCGDFFSLESCRVFTGTFLCWDMWLCSNLCAWLMTHPKIQISFSKFHLYFDKLTSFFFSSFLFLPSLHPSVPLSLPPFFHFLSFLLLFLNLKIFIMSEIDSKHGYRQWRLKEMKNLNEVIWLDYITRKRGSSVRPKPYWISMVCGSYTSSLSSFCFYFA